MTFLSEDARQALAELFTKPLPYPVMAIAVLALSLGSFQTQENRWQDGSAPTPNKPVRVTAVDDGELTLLPPDMVNEIRNDECLSFSIWVFNASHTRCPGFEGFREGNRESYIFYSNVEFNDAIEWLKQAANSRYCDPVNTQLVLSMATIHTTSDPVCQVMLDLAQHPGIIEPLRQETEDVLTTHG
ncbi:hypothetical protein B0T14DRAFT_569280 [Immersiella caudata]|uniref:Uncharacterized protein n=1 Tax=Immersiella caudata TaxID=314043 RepID=A0AA39U711_9PEZI|nr:hypothetical protein B0T14DRAFT_569280 [Immersiella caudata]